MTEQRLNGAVRRRRSGAEGARLVAEFERSGLGRKEFCAAHGLSVPTLDAWRRRVASSASEEQMVSVEIVGEHAGMRLRRPGVMERRRHFRIVLGDGLGIEVEPGFDAAELRRLLAVLDGTVQPVLGFGAATRIFVATGATDMRLSFNGLYALAVGQLQQDPQSGHLFLFANKRRDRMKILFFDGSSLWVCARRMEQGRLHWPRSAEGRVQLTREEFALLIGGIDLTQTRPRKWYRQGMGEESQEYRKSV